MPMQTPDMAVPVNDAVIDYTLYPDADGHFGRYGGRFVAETLIGPLEDLAAAYDAARVDPAFVEYPRMPVIHALHPQAQQSARTNQQRR